MHAHVCLCDGPSPSEPWMEAPEGRDSVFFNFVSIAPRMHLAHGPWWVHLAHSRAQKVFIE